MPTNTYTLINSTKLTSAQQNVTLGSLGSYDDLVIIINGTISSGTASIGARFNGDTGANYNDERLYGSGSSAAGGLFTSQSWTRSPAVLSSTGTGSSMWYIPGYRKAIGKGCIGYSVTEGFGITITTGMWNSTSAITSIVLFPDNGNNFNTNTVFTVFGITQA